MGQTSPVSPTEGIRVKTPNQVALVNANLHVSPGQSFEQGMLLLKDDHVIYAGPKKEIPAGYRSVDMDGYSIYPGFVEAYSQYGLEKGERTRGRGNRTLKFDGTRKGGNAWNDAIHAEIDWVTQFQPDPKESKEFLEAGFTTVQSCKLDGIFRGRGFITHLGEGIPNDLILKPYTFQFASFNKGSSQQEYPNSLMGSMALIRQTFLDVDWYEKAHRAYDLNPMQEMPEFNVAIEALAKQKGQPIVFETDDELSLQRASHLASEYSIPLVQLGSGYEYSVIDAVKKSVSTLVLPIAFPGLPSIKSVGDEMDVSLADLRHWETAPYNPKRVAEAKIEFALTTAKLDNKKDFLANLRKAVKYGLKKETAFASLTTVPSQLLGIDDMVGSLAEGKLADFIVTDGDIFDEKTKIYSVWISGEENELEKRPDVDFAGSYLLSFSNREFPLVISGKPDSHEGHLKVGDEKLQLKDVAVSVSKLSFSISFDSLPPGGVIRFSGRRSGDDLSGYGTDASGVSFFWVAAPHAIEPDSADGESKDQDDSDAPEEEKAPESDSEILPPVARLTYPNKAFGFDALPRPENVLVKNATIWTSEDTGILVNHDMLVRDGKIAGIGQGLKAPEGFRIIDATGKHVTAGIIDPHSHIAISGNVNECTEGITAEVRIGDVVNPEHITIYRQLAGGTTTSLLLHGSCNAIGGQSQLIKLRWGADAEGLKFENAPRTIKFALGENIKRSSWGEQHRIRYPQTRMGVESLIRDAFQAAVEYEHAWDKYESLSGKNRRNMLPPRVDLEMEAVRDIINSKLFIVCHSYVQSEVLALMRLTEEYGFHVQNFTHILEGYKVAPEMAKHGATASSFSDWWAYKFEVYDAIPYNVALMTEKGVIASINSDDGDLGSRLNQEAAKSIKYGNMSREDAIKLCTINSAIQLRVQDRIGSLKEGKDADFVIWNGDPLSNYSHPEETWIDGARYFDIDENSLRRDRDRDEKFALIQKVLKYNEKNGKSGKKGSRKGFKRPDDEYHCEDCFDYWERINNAEI